MTRVSTFRLIAWICLVAISVGSCGCAQNLANLMRLFGKDKMPAAYPKLVGKKVAIVCGNENGLSNDANSTLFTRYFSELLKQNVKNISIVRQDEVDSWLDNRGWKESDFGEIGKAVGADYVISVQLANLSLKDGPTLYRGKSDITLTVYDVKDDGRVDHRYNQVEHTYPTIGGIPVTDTTEARVRSLYLTVVSRQLAMIFYPHEPNELVGLDAESNSF